MDTPIPVSLGTTPSMGILAAPGMEAWLRECAIKRRVPVLIHELGSEQERREIGPRETLEKTCKQLDEIGDPIRWGAAARVRNAEEAAQFANAGFTWFIFDLAHAVDHRAADLSIEELDAALVAFEDAYVYVRDWHFEYEGREFVAGSGLPIRLTPEVLARIAVKFAAAFVLAGEMDRALRTCWAGRGTLPDVEISFAPGAPTTTREEMLFVSNELRRRIGGVLVSIAPSLGHEFEPGALLPENRGALSALVSGLSAAAFPTKITIPGPLAPCADTSKTPHLDVTESGRLSVLSAVLQRSPSTFRAWLEAARSAFPISRAGWPISLGEEEARFLPQVADHDLESTFLRHPSGRQLLLTTWEDVSHGEIGAKARTLLAG